MRASRLDAQDLPDLDPKDFSADQRDLIKQMLSTFDSLKQDPNLPQNVKDLINDLSDKLKAFR